MDLIRAQHLLTKIQAFIEDGHSNSLSRLEKDLMKSYVIQLYDALSSDAQSKTPDVVKAPEMPAQKFHQPETPPIHTPKPVVQPEEKFVFEPEVKEVPQIVPETKVPVVEPVITARKPEPKPVYAEHTEPVLKVVHQPETIQTHQDANAELSKLFAMPFGDDSSGILSRAPVASIEAALGLNERIFTLNELFGGNKSLFDSTCAELNNLHSYEEASSLLLRGPARQFDWSDPARIKMAEHFIRIVARRYPRH
jgi:hypothetical protein